MPILNWMGREKAVKHDKEVALKILHEDKSLSYGTGDNILVHGDNLEALKSLLPFYAGEVKCIYIDPPYNTGSAFEHYDDNLEHSTWLNMMYPRLKLLREFLREDGSIWISIDDDEQAYMKVMCDEIFGRQNFVATCIWHKKHTRANDAQWFSDNHDYIIVYAKKKKNEKNKAYWRPNLLPRTEQSDTNYDNPDNDPRGAWQSLPLQAKSGSDHNFSHTFSNGVVWRPPAGRFSAFSHESLDEMDRDNRIWFGKNGKNVPRYKKFLFEVKDGMVPTTIWFRDEVGDNQEAKEEQKELSPDSIFGTPKPERLIQRILTLATNEGDLVLDSFLGSGTTAAVAHKMGRRWIGIEMGDHAKTHCAVRLKKVVDGEQGGVSTAVNWQGGGGFRFYELGETILNEKGQLSASIPYDVLAAHIWWQETGIGWKGVNKKNTVLGVHEGVAYALLYNGILNDRSVNGGNVLTRQTLGIIKEDLGELDYEKLIVYGEACRLGDARLAEEKINFRQTPYDVVTRR